MMPFLPILLVLAGLTLFLTRRRHKAIAYTESASASISRPQSPSARVIVKGHTYSDSIENTPSGQTRSTKVETVQRCCIIGAGRVGAITGIVLASQNPQAHFYVVDSDERLISAWKSDRLPVLEPGLEQIVFEAQGDGERRRKLSNLTFSTNVHAGVAVADLVFLCCEMSIRDEDPSLAELEPTLQTIAHASTGHKIIVQRTTAPLGILTSIKKRLKEISSPTATFSLLSNPEFTLPGSTLLDTLHPPRILLGHASPPETDPDTTSLTALKRLYAPFTPPDRLITMDTWTTELGKIAASALIAQQIASLNSLRLLCDATKADTRSVVEMLGVPDVSRAGRAWSGSEVRCLVLLARGLGFDSVAEYWGGVVGMEGVYYSVVARGVVGRLRLGGEELGMEGRKVAVVGVGVCERLSTGMRLVRELRDAGVVVCVYDAYASRELGEYSLRGEGIDGVVVAESVEEACLGCAAVVVQADSSTLGVRWEVVVSQMAAPRVFVDCGGVTDGVRMRELGFDVLQVEEVRSVSRFSN